MVSDILENFGSATALTITVASLASSASFVGRQSTVVDNASTTKLPRIYIACSIKLGTSPTANTAVYVFGIRSNKDTTAIRDDGAGASDAGWTRKSCALLRRPNGDPSVLYAGSAPATGDVLSGLFIFDDPGKEWAIGIAHNTGVILNATGANHVVGYYADNPQAQ